MHFPPLFLVAVQEIPIAALAGRPTTTKQTTQSAIAMQTEPDSTNPSDCIHLRLYKKTHACFAKLKIIVSSVVSQIFFFFRFTSGSSF